MTLFNSSRSLKLSRMTLDNPFNSVGSARRRKEQTQRRNIKLIKEFLSERMKEERDKTSALACLREQKNRSSIDKATYHRLRKVLVLSHEMKRIETLELLSRQTEKGKRLF